MSSSISGTMDNIGAYAQTTSNVNSDKKTSDVKKNNASGKTVGNPKLSEKASKYYEQLKKKYSNMDFVLVSNDMKEQAKANAAGYANPSKMVVLVDEEKIERMAEDENYRKQYEGIIANAASGLSSMKSAFSSQSDNVKGFGMQINDNGTTSYFAVLKKSSKAQKARIEKNAEKKKQDKEIKDKKAEEKKNKEKLEESKRTDSSISDVEDLDDTVVITASSVEELIEKVKQHNQMYSGDTVISDIEKNVGQKFDYSL